MSYDCYCDNGDPPEFYHCDIRRARKSHKCSECAGTIVVGEKYEHVRGKWDGYLDTYDTCQRCYDIWIWTKNNLPCLCWAHGSRVDDCVEAVREATAWAPEETRGLRFGLGRLLVKRRQHSVGIQ